MSSEVQQRYEELKQQEAFIREKTAEIARDAIAILNVDLPLFVEREIKRAFIADPDFGEKLSDEQLRALKEEIRQRGKRKAEEITARLQDAELWMAGNRFLEGAKSLEDHRELWALVDEIAGVTRELLAEHGFPPAAQGADIRYRQPTWFISSRLMTTVAEKYWRKMMEWAEVRRELEELDNQSRREALKPRWDAVC